MEEVLHLTSASCHDAMARYSYTCLHAQLTTETKIDIAIIIPKLFSNQKTDQCIGSLWKDHRDFHVRWQLSGSTNSLFNGCVGHAGDGVDLEN